MNIPPWLSTAAADMFIPTWTQAEGLVAVLASGLVMIVLGRAVLGARILPEIALIAGWGLVSLVLTLWGVTTPADMRAPAIGLIATAAVASVLKRGRLNRPDLIAIGRLLAIALPLLAVLAAAYPSQPDMFTNQLPNAAYLHDYGKFPAVNRPPLLAIWPAFPYNLQLAAFLPSLLVPEYPPNLLMQVNLMLELAVALLLARVMTRSDSPPSWTAIGGGVLLATFVNPGFDPKIEFSGYGDPTIAVALAVAAWQSERLLAALAANKSAAAEILTLTFLLLAGVAIKQVSVLLVTSVVFSAFLIGACDRRVGARTALVAFAPALFPALLMIGIWRFYVEAHFTPGDELRFLPFGQWGLASLPAILANMAVRIGERLPFFVVLYGVALSAVPLAVRLGLTPATRLFLMTFGVTLIYTAFLLFTYVAHFPGEIGASAHSFFRYNGHLEFLITLAVVAFVRERWLRRSQSNPRPGWLWARWSVAAPVARGAVIALALLAPVIGVGWIRSDQRKPQTLVWDLARFAAPHFQDGDRIALLLPGDNRSVALMLRVAIAISQPRHALTRFDDMNRADAQSLERARHNGDTYALISCVPGELARSPVGQSLKLPAGSAALLAYDGANWRLMTTHPYPGDLPPSRTWTAALSPGPFCG